MGQELELGGYTGRVEGGDDLEEALSVVGAGSFGVEGAFFFDLCEQE